MGVANLGMHDMTFYLFLMDHVGYFTNNLTGDMIEYYYDKFKLNTNKFRYIHNIIGCYPEFIGR